MTTEPRYDAVAELYDSMSPDDYTAAPDVALLELVGPVEGLRVLDVACEIEHVVRADRAGGRAGPFATAP
jgi:hypothetical protein